MKEKCAQCANPNLKGIHTCKKRNLAADVEDPQKKTFSPFRTGRIDWRTGKVIEWIDLDPAADLRVGRDTQKALKTSTHTLGWYMQLKEMAHTKMKQEKYKSHQIFEEVYDEIRSQSAKLSETQVKNKVHLSPDWRKRTEKYMQWRNRYRMLHELCIALKDRNDNLRTLESSERKEREGAF